MDLPIDAEGNLECTICSETIGTQKEDCTTESPIELPCGHIFGDTCLATWRNNNNICPNCRAPCPDEHGTYATRTRARREGEDSESLRNIHEMVRRIDGEDRNLLVQIEEAEDALRGAASMINRARRYSVSEARIRRVGARTELRQPVPLFPRTIVEGPTRAGAVPPGRAAGVPSSTLGSSNSRSDGIRGLLGMNFSASIQRRRSDATRLTSPESSQARLRGRGFERANAIIDHGRRRSDFETDIFMDIGGGLSQSVETTQATRRARTRVQDLLASSDENMSEMASLAALRPQTSASMIRGISEQRPQTIASMIREARQRMATLPNGQHNASHAWMEQDPISRSEALRSQDPHLLALWLHQQNVAELYELRIMEQDLQTGEEARGTQRMGHIISDRRRARETFMRDIVDTDVDFALEVGPELRRLEYEGADNMSDLHRIRRETQEAVAEGGRPRNRARVRYEAGDTSQLSIREMWARLGGRAP